MAEVIAATKKERKFFVSGIIGGDTNANAVSQFLDESNGEDITVVINSPGGDVFDGIAVYNLLRNAGNKVKVEIVGLAASAASIIAMAGNDVAMAESATLMIHNPFTGQHGDSKQMQRTAENLAKLEKDLAKIYSNRTKIPENEIKQMMDNETWMSAEVAKKKGFIDRIIKTDNVILNCAGLDRMHYKNVPQEIINQMSFTDKAWNGSASRFDIEQLQRAVPRAVAAYAKAVAQKENREVAKGDLILRYKEPDGVVNVNGVRAALAAIDNMVPHLTQDIFNKAKTELQKMLEEYNSKKQSEGIGGAILASQKIKVQIGKHVYPLTDREFQMLDQVKNLLGVSEESEIIEALEKKLKSGDNSEIKSELQKAQAKVTELEKKVSDSNKLIDVEKGGYDNELNRTKALLETAQAAIDELKNKNAAFESKQKIYDNQILALQKESKDRELDKVKAEIKDMSTPNDATKKVYLNPAMGESLLAVYESGGYAEYEKTRDVVKAGGRIHVAVLENQGSTGDAPANGGDPIEKFEKAIQERMKANTKLTYETALDEVIAEKPELFEAYNRSVMGEE